MHEGRRQTSRQSAHAGSRLKLNYERGRSRLTSQPSSRTGENPPYGMIGGIEETSASSEARSAPRSHPTPGRRIAVAVPGLGSKSSRWLRASLQPATLLGLLMIAACWIGVVVELKMER